MEDNVTKITPFGYSIFPTPLLILSISKAKTTVRTTAPEILLKEQVILNENRTNVSNEKANLILSSVDNDEIDMAKFQSSIIPISITTTPVSRTENVSKERVNIISFEDDITTKNSNGSNLIVVANDDDQPTATIAPKICTKMASNEEDISNIPEICTKAEIVSNLNVAASNNDNDDEINNAKFQSTTVSIPVPITTTPVFVLNKDIVLNLNVVDADDDDDDIDNAKSPPECENSIGDLDCIQDEYYQVKVEYGSISNRSDDINLPPLPPESPACAINHPNIPNNGEILSLPLISLVYQVKQSNKVKTLIEEVNEEYLFWRPHRDEGYTVEEKIVLTILLS